MKSIISAIYNGTLKPVQSTIPDDENYSKVMSDMLTLRQTLEMELTSEQKQIFENLLDEQEKLSYINELTAFTEGFSLAVQLILEALSDKP